MSDLIEALRSDEVPMRATAVFELGQQQNPATLEALIWLLGDESVWVRCNAAEALGEFRNEAVVSPLVRFLRFGIDLEPPPPEGRGTVSLLRGYRYRRFADPAYEAWVQEQDIQIDDPTFSLVGSARLALQKVGLPATDHLLGLLKDDSVYVQAIAVSLLNKMAMRKEPLNLLKRTLVASDPVLRRNAALALGRFGNIGAVEPLLGMVMDDDVQVRSAVIEALGDIQHPRTIPALRRALNDDDEEVHHVAWAALYNMGIEPEDLQDE